MTHTVELLFQAVHKLIYVCNYMWITVLLDESEPKYLSFTHFLSFSPLILHILYDVICSIVVHSLCASGGFRTLALVKHKLGILPWRVHLSYLSSSGCLSFFMVVGGASLAILESGY